jgi:hypothetical protein
MTRVCTAVSKGCYLTSTTDCCGYSDNADRARVFGEVRVVQTPLSQPCCRRWRMRVLKARYMYMCATHIQRVIRGNLGKQLVNARKAERYREAVYIPAVITLQRMMRGQIVRQVRQLTRCSCTANYCCAKDVRLRKLLAVSAVRIQRAYRAMRKRAEVTNAWVAMTNLVRYDTYCTHAGLDLLRTHQCKMCN